eukprot:jgi/Chlat1/4078/Chrsp26S04118
MAEARSMLVGGVEDGSPGQEQKRSWRTNCCIILVPVLLCILLALLQLLIDHTVNNSSDNKCGCRDICASDGSCQKVCGIQRCFVRWSTRRVTLPSFRCLRRSTARRYSGCSDPTAFGCPNELILYTGGNRTVADALATRLLIDDITNSYAADGDATNVTQELFLGTSAEAPFTIYVESAYADVDRTPAYYVLNNCSSSTSAERSFIQSAAVNSTSFEVLNTELNIPAEFLTCVSVPSYPLGYKSSVQDIDSTLYSGYRKAPGSNDITRGYMHGYDFQNTNSRAYDTVLIYNNTRNNDTGQNRPPLLRVNAAANMAARAFLRWTAGPAYDVKLLHIAEMPKPTTSLNLDFSSLLGPLFFMWVVQLLLPVYLTSIVYEKERRLRLMMKMHGLGDRSYWTVTYLYNLALYIVYIILFILFGTAVRLKFFYKNSYGIEIILFFLYGNVQIALAFLLSVFFSSSKTATVTAYIYVFGTGLLGEFLLANFIEHQATPDIVVYLLQLVPGFGLYRGLYELSQYSFRASYQNSSGMEFSNLGDSGNGMIEVWVVFIVEWFIFMILAYYLEQVLSSTTGVNKHPLYFLGKKRSSERRNEVAPVIPGGATSRVRRASSADSTLTIEPEDVSAERERVRNIPEGTNNSAIVIRDLRKVYPGSGVVKDKVACHALNLAVERGECFGLLGPNGAGKTTSISMLTGFLEPSGGTAQVEGFDIRMEMDNIYQIMGVCPQHDLLWETLTAREHLLFYGRLKNLTGRDLSDQVDSALRSVNLFANGVGNKQAGKYSGGMKRRLSVAISLIGKPLVCYLDEPSTGLDPASRRNLWDVVREAKKDRAIILTTHSMEEAETLCDRLGIFVDGRLMCLGNPKELTARYGSYYIFTIMVDPSEESAAASLVRDMCPSGRLTYQLAGTLKYELPRDKIDLTTVFQTMEKAKGRGMGVRDWAVTNTTLEEVFIRICRDTRASSADAFEEENGKKKNWWKRLWV